MLAVLAQKFEPITEKVPTEINSTSEKADHVEVAKGKDLTLYFDTRKCIHSRFCVLDAPSVFKANTPGTWIFPDAMRTEELVSVAHSCPSGAITYSRSDGGPPETSPLVNTLKIRENGPYAIHASVKIEKSGQINRVTLCRCGASKNKPYCDGSHKAAGFAATGEPASRDSQSLTIRDGNLEIVPARNGPLSVSGNLEICSGTGRTVDRVSAVKLCRCGASESKPFCDGSHARVGFEA